MEYKRITDSIGNIMFTDIAKDTRGIKIGYDIFVTPSGQKHRHPIGRVVPGDSLLIIERHALTPIHQRHGGYHINRHVLSEYPGGPDAFTRVALVELDTRTVYLMRARDIIAEASAPLVFRPGLTGQCFLHREWCMYYALTSPNQIALIMENTPNRYR